MTKKGMRWAAASGLALMLGQSSFADLSVYPAKGQSAEKMSQDKYECYNWAKGQTGYDPQAAAQSGQTQQPQQPSTGAGRGAAKGAAAGAVGGAIAGNAGKGAAVGAGVGAMGGAHKRRKEEQQAQQQQQQAQAQNQQLMANFNKAQSACLTGRGYTVG